MITILTLFSGGTGTPKLLQGLVELVSPDDITVIANTGEDVEVSGLKVSPDLDTVVYTLAGMIDEEKWYGVEDDSFETHEMLSELGHEELLKIGDRDRAVKLYRTIRMEEGATLSQVTGEICEALDVSATVLPMTDDKVRTQIVTDKGKMPFHKYWVARGAKDQVKDVNFLNSKKANPAPGVIDSLKNSDNIIIGPSNPMTSLGPILSIDEIRSTLEKNREKVLAISPIIGEAPVSGPTGDLMDGLGYEVTSVGVGQIYKDIVNTFYVHEEDEDMVPKIEDLGLDVYLADILISDKSSKIELAEKILETIGYE